MPKTSEWIQFVKKVYEAGKPKGMKFSDALKEASKQWKKKAPVKKPKALRVKKKGK